MGTAKKYGERCIVCWTGEFGECSKCGSEDYCVYEDEEKPSVKLCEGCGGKTTDGRHEHVSAAERERYECSLDPDEDRERPDHYDSEPPEPWEPAQPWERD
jgi:hypothetical protein